MMNGRVIASERLGHSILEGANPVIVDSYSVRLTW